MTEAGSPFEAVKTLGPPGRAAFLLLCEHASNDFPDVFGTLGLDAQVRQSHVAWDPGALALAKRLSADFAVPLVHGAVSRLCYDCNRPPEALDSIPERSEVFDIPGNRELSAQQRAARAQAIYFPFLAAVDAAVAEARPGAIVTIHSFTPVYFGTPRAVEIGVLFDADTRLAEALLAQDWGGYDVRGNEPYGPDDGVTHSLKLHAVSRGLPNVMIEVRNDLLATPDGAEAVFAVLKTNLAKALADIGVALKETA
jgi:predicted N-formylglutamate amidohydrolase